MNAPRYTANDFDPTSVTEAAMMMSAAAIATYPNWITWRGFTLGSSLGMPSASAKVGTPVTMEMTPTSMGVQPETSCRYGAMRMDWAPMKKNMTAFATRPARTCGVFKNDCGRSATPFFCSTRFSTGMSAARTSNPTSAMGSAGEMPNSVNGQPARGSMRPQDEMLEMPMRNRNRPDAASATPAPSKASFSFVWLIAGRRSEARNTAMKYAARTKNVACMPAASKMTPSARGSSADRPDAAPMQPKATMRFPPR